MKFSKYYDLEGKHAFLSPSKGSWVNYDLDKLEATFSKHMAVQRGVALHELACDAIRLGVRLHKTKQTVNLFVNDAISFRMEPEQILFYSENCFGTADAICFRDDILRIHDLKTGSTTASMTQLKIYAALFCLEYKMKPKKINIELRLYQSNDIVVCVPEPDEIMYISDKIIAFDKRIKEIQSLDI